MRRQLSEPKPKEGPPREPVEPPPTHPDPSREVPEPAPIDDPRPPQPRKIL